MRRHSPFEFWQSVTGSLDDGETPAGAARRELFEETGFTTEGALSGGNLPRTFTIDPRWRDRYAPGITENVEHEWRYCLAEVVDVRIDKTEHSASRWVSIDTAIDEVWSWTNKAALKALRNELRKARQPV